VEESDWHGPVFGLGSLEAAMTRMDWNPGGLVAVRAEENTRESLFAAMQRREVYATSGTRIHLNFEASTESLTCDADGGEADIPMGGSFQTGLPTFRMEVSKDRMPLAKLEVVKGWIEDGIFQESVTPVWQGETASRCLVWQDEGFDALSAAFWYLRVTEAGTPRWSANLCRREGRCDEFPGADVMVEERAWSSPIWYLPELN